MGEEERSCEASENEFVNNRGSLGRSSFWGMVAYLVGSVAGLITIPILLGRLGAVRFGVYVTVQTIVAYASLARMGMGSGFVQGFTNALKGRQGLSVGGLLGTGFSVLAVVAVGLLIIVTALNQVLAGFLNVPQDLGRDFALLIVGAMVGLGFGSLQSPFSGFLSALERVDVVAKISLASIVVGALAQVLVVVTGGGLRWLAVVMALSNALGLVALILAARIVGGRGWWHGVRFERSSFLFLRRYGFRMQMTNISGLVGRSVNRIWLAALGSPASVTLYDVADRASYSLVYSVSPLAAALNPRSAALSLDPGGRAELHTLYTKSTQVAAYLGSALGLFAFVCAAVILQAWLGLVDPQSAWALRALALGYSTAVSFIAAATVARAQNVPSLVARGAAVFSVVGIVAGLVGTMVAGVRGAATALASAHAAYTLVFTLIVERKLLGIRSGTALLVVGRAWAPNILAAGATWLFMVLGPWQPEALPRPSALALLVLCFAIFVTLSVTLAILAGTFPGPLRKRLSQVGATLLKLGNPTNWMGLCNRQRRRDDRNT